MGTLECCYGRAANGHRIAIDTIVTGKVEHRHHHHHPIRLLVHIDGAATKEGKKWNPCYQLAMTHGEPFSIAYQQRLLFFADVARVLREIG